MLLYLVNSRRRHRKNLLRPKHSKILNTNDVEKWKKLLFEEIYLSKSPLPANLIDVYFLLKTNKYFLFFNIIK